MLPFQSHSVFILSLHRSNIHIFLNRQKSMQSGYLPYDGFKWLKNVDNFDVNSINENSPIGYILEVDLKYPEE